MLFFGHSLLALFDATPEVISVGYTRLVMVFSAYTFSMLYEVMSGYLRGFGISLVPALLTVIGVVGVRITWIAFVFPAHRTFEAIMIVYPIGLAATAVLISIALLCYRPSSDSPLNLKRVRLAAVHERGDSPGQSAGKNPFRERARLGERTMVGEG